MSCYCWSGTATKVCIVQPAKSVLTLARAPIGCVLPALLCGFICRHRSTGAPEQSQTTRFKTIPTPDAPHHHQERAAATHSDSGNTQQQHEDAKAAKMSECIVSMQLSEPRRLRRKPPRTARRPARLYFALVGALKAACRGASLFPEAAPSRRDISPLRVQSS